MITKALLDISCLNRYSILNTNLNVIKAIGLHMKLDLNFLILENKIFLAKQYLF